MTKRVARHTTDWAMERFQLRAFVSEADLRRAEGEMYDFLKWKLGGPTAVCLQYISGDYSHFERGYSDEAAAAIVGMTLPGTGRPDFAIMKTVHHKLTEETLYGVLTAYCVYNLVAPKSDTRDYPKTAGKVGDGTYNPFGRPEDRPYGNSQNPYTPPQDATPAPSVDTSLPNDPRGAGKTSPDVADDNRATPAEMQKCQENARANASGIADFILKTDVFSFDVAATSRYDVKDELLNVLIKAYQLKKLDVPARSLLQRASQGYNLPKSPVGSHVLSLAGPGNLTPHEELVTFLYWLYKNGHAGPQALFQPSAAFDDEAAAAFMGVKFQHAVPKNLQPSSIASQREQSPLGPNRTAFAMIPARMATPEVVQVVNRLVPQGVIVATDIYIMNPVQFSGPLVTSLVRAYNPGSSSPSIAPQLHPQPSRLNPPGKLPSGVQKRGTESESAGPESGEENKIPSGGREGGK